MVSCPDDSRGTRAKGRSARVTDFLRERTGCRTGLSARRLRSPLWLRGAFAGGAIPQDRIQTSMIFPAEAMPKACFHKPVRSFPIRKMSE